VLRAGKRLSAYGRDYVTVTGSSATVAVSGDSVQANGAATNTYSVFAPQQIRTVTVNGAPVRSCRQGDYVVFPCKIVTELTLSAPASAPATDAVELVANLTAAGQGIAGQTVAFKVGQLSTSAVTDAAGVARASLPLDLDAGSYPVTAVFTGQGDYLPSSTSRVLEVVRDATSLVYTGQTAAKGDTVDVSAVLTEDAGVPMSGQVVVFTVGNVTASAVTDANGRASTTVVVPDHGRSQPVTARFAETARHAAGSADATVTWGSGGRLPV